MHEDYLVPLAVEGYKVNDAKGQSIECVRGMYRLGVSSSASILHQVQPVFCIKFSQQSTHK